MKGDPLGIFRNMLSRHDNSGRSVIIDRVTGYSGWPTFGVFYEPPLEPDQAWRCIECEKHSEALETALVMAAGELPIIDRTDGQ